MLCQGGCLSTRNAGCLSTRNAALAVCRTIARGTRVRRCDSAEAMCNRPLYLMLVCRCASPSSPSTRAVSSLFEPRRGVFQPVTRGVSQPVTLPWLTSARTIARGTRVRRCDSAETMCNRRCVYLIVSAWGASPAQWAEVLAPTRLNLLLFSLGIPPDCSLLGVSVSSSSAGRVRESGLAVAGRRPFPAVGLAAP